MENIINSDPTLKYFIRDAEIDWFNNHQVDLRFASLQIALNKFIDQLIIHHGGNNC